MVLPVPSTPSSATTPLAVPPAAGNAVPRQTRAPRASLIDSYERVGEPVERIRANTAAPQSTASWLWSWVSRAGQVIKDVFTSAKEAIGSLVSLIGELLSRVARKGGLNTETAGERARRHRDEIDALLARIARDQLTREQLETEMEARGWTMAQKSSFQALVDEANQDDVAAAAASAAMSARAKTAAVASASS